MNNRYDLVYHCDASAAIGFGHVKRGLDVVRTIQDQRPDLTLAIAGRHSSSARDFLGRYLPSGVEIEEKPFTWEARVVVIDTMSDATNSEYIDPGLCRQARSTCERLALVLGVIAIDLLPQVDVVINHIPGLCVRGAAPDLFVGFQYAPVSPSLLRRARRGVQSGASRILAIVGSNTEQDGPEILLEMLQGYASTEIDLVVSPQYPQERLGDLENAGDGVRVIRNAPCLAPFFDTAAAVLSTYGNATFESLALHKPTYVLSYKSIQERYADYLEQRGLVVNLGRFVDMRRERLNELFAARTRSKLQAAAQSAFQADCGIHNIARVLIDQIDSVPRLIRR